GGVDCAASPVQTLPIAPARSTRTSRLPFIFSTLNSRLSTLGYRLLSTIASRRHLLILMQRQLLHAPVQHLGDIQLVLGLTVDLVDPAELLQLFPGFAEHAEHGAVEGQLVDAARERIRHVHVLRRSWRDANRP